MYEDLQQPDLVIRVQHEISARMQELDLAIDSYAKLLVELELLELEARTQAAESRRTWGPTT
jgi:hypothetical protein